MAEKIETRLRQEYGVELDGVWFPWDLLEQVSERTSNDYLAENPMWFHLSPEQKRVLLALGYAQSETRGGIHGTERLREFMDNLDFPDSLPWVTPEMVQEALITYIRSSRMQDPASMIRDVLNAGIKEGRGKDD